MFYRLVILACVAVFWSAGTAFAQSGSFNIRGQIRNADGGGAIPNAIVMLEGPRDRKQATSDRRGRFIFAALPSGSYTIRVSMLGFKTAIERFMLLNASIIDAVIRLTPEKKRTAKISSKPISVRVALIPKEARKEFERGTKELHKQNKPDRSLQYFKKALGLYPDFDEAYVQLGIAYSLLSREEEAETTFLRAINLYSKNTRAHMFLGKLYYQQGKLDASVEQLKEAITLDVNNWLVHRDLANVLAKLRKFEEAYQHAERAHLLKEDEQDVHLVFYNACLNKKDYVGALAELGEYVRLYPKSETAQKMLAIRKALSQKASEQDQ